MSVTFKVERLDELLDVLADTDRRLADFRPVWADLRVRWQVRVDRHWRTARWRSLSPRYARQVGRTRATLDTSQGKTPPGLDHAPGQLHRLVREPETYEPTKTSLTMGVRMGLGRSHAFYAYFHQQGFKTMPRRAVVERLTPHERADWNQEVADHVFAGLRGA